jgi:galactoside O-acetyltransferase
MGERRKTQAAVTSEGVSALQRYLQVIVGRRSISAFLYFEWCTLLGIIPGAAGLMLRKLFWPRLFGRCGRGTVFGANVILRHPHRIVLGDRIVISDGCILDARNERTEHAIHIGSDTILSNDVMLSCKEGTIHIGERGGIGVRTTIHSVNGCPVILGEDVLIGPGCYLAGGGNYRIERTDISMAQQGLRADEGVTLEDAIWLGANVTILAGDSIGRGSVIAAGAVVSKPVEPMSICGGVPARVL